MPKPSTSERARGVLIFAIKLLVSVGLLWWVSSKISWHDSQDATGAITPGLKSTIASARIQPLVIGILLMALPTILVSLRLWLLMRVTGVGLSLWRVFVVTIGGHFFSILLPGITGGDVPKAILVARDAQGKAEGIAMLVADRAIGATALMAIGSAAALSRLDDPLLGRPGLILLAITGLLILGAFAYAWGPLRKILRIERILLALPLGQILTRMDTALRVAFTNKLTIAFAFGLSVLSHGSTIVAWTCFVRAFGQDAPLAELAVYVPLILLVSTLPISISGWGVREKMAETFFVAAGMPAAVAITVALLYQSAYMLWALPGAFLVPLLRRAEPNASPGHSTPGDSTPGDRPYVA